jgi:diacylglycerol kinase family enzyme
VANSKKERKRELKAHGKKADLIVIGGGDGTISKALPQLLKLKKPVAVLPLGTANDFARTIGLPADPLQAAEVPLSGRKHRIDVGWFTSDPVSMSQASGPRPRSLRRRPRNSSRSGESLLM